MAKTKTKQQAAVLEPGPRWMGRNFSPRVQVHSASGRYLFRIHPEMAITMCREGSVDVDPDGRRIWKLTLLQVAGQKCGPPTDPTPRNYGTQPSVFKEVLDTDDARYRLYQFRRIAKADRWATAAWARVLAPSS